MDAMDAGTMELGNRLDAFARARLSPDPRVTARTRARVMREARLSFEAARIAVHVAPALAAASRRSMSRRVLMPFLAASLWLGIAAGSIAAAQAGGPLYPARMWVESAMLPSEAGPRTAAELNRLDARLAEALAGAASGDRSAIGAALDAYYLIAENALTDTDGDPALAAQVAEALDQHRAVLTIIAARLADKGNVTASEAIDLNIQRAIEHNAAVIRAIGQQGNPQPRAGSGASDGSSGGNGSGGGSDAAGGGGGGGATHPPAADGTSPPPPTQKPVKTPKPAPERPPNGPSN